MKKVLWACSALGLLMAMTMQLSAQEKREKLSRIIAETNIVKATVAEIDHKKREVILKDEEGNKVKMKVSEDVENLDRVRKGDRVIAGYYQSAAITVNKPGETSPEPAADEVIVSEKGEKPRRAIVKTTQITATVEDIDYEKRQVKLKGPEGNTVKITVGDAVKRLDEVKKGDQIVARFTEALAVSVSKPEE